MSRRAPRPPRYTVLARGEVLADVAALAGYGVEVVLAAAAVAEDLA